jgi:hypothetical protein
MIRVFAASTLLFLSLTASGAQPATRPPERFHVVLSPEEKRHVLDGDFAIKRTVAEIPATVQSALARLFVEPDFQMANPGEKYQATDVIESGPPLPWRRLVFAGVSKDRCFVHYERGGWGHSYYVAVFQLPRGNETSARPIWAGAGTTQAGDLDALRAAVTSGRFADDKEYYW